MSEKPFNIDTLLVSRLIATQFPQWKDLPIRPVETSGWDNQTFHLGENMLVRMPSAAEYAFQVEKEQVWLPKLASFLPLYIPTPVGIGQAGEGYPWKWSVYRWVEGESAATAKIEDLSAFAATLAHFLRAFQGIESTGVPLHGAQSFYQGGPLITYDQEVRRALTVIQDKIDVQQVKYVWEAALNSFWQNDPVWIHGDISVGNLIVRDGMLVAVIDFGQLAIGDPACDLAIAWTLFNGESRQMFQKTLELDSNTWMRGRGWALWKAVIVAAGFTNPGNRESAKCWQVMDELIGTI